MTAGGFSTKRLTRVRELLDRLVDSGFVPGVLVVLARHGEVNTQATGTLAFDGAGSGTPMAGDTICRMGSMTKPIVAACAMTLVEDCTLRLDDPVDDLLPELAERARSPTRWTHSASLRQTSGSAGSATCRSCTSQESAGCTTPPPT